MYTNTPFAFGFSHINASPAYFTISALCKSLQQQVYCESWRAVVSMPVLGRGRGGLCSHVSRINIEVVGWGWEREGRGAYSNYDIRRFSSDCVC